MTTLNDLPDVILSNIFAAVIDARSRNCLSLVCRKFLALERSTRFSLTLRGNARDLFMIPNSFRSVINLDLSLLSPWGHSLLSSPPSDPHLLAHRLKVAFPSVTALTVYSRSPSTLHFLLPQWPGLRHIKLVRWHQRNSQLPIGADFLPLFEHCKSLQSIDLSSFYYWTEDLPIVLHQHPDVSASLTHLDLLTSSFTEGFKSQEIRQITQICPSLKSFLAACTMDPRYIGFVGDETLLAIASNCPKLRLLHLADTASLVNLRGDPNSDPENEDAKITAATLVEVFSGLPLLEELILDLEKNVRCSGLALEVLNTKCKKLRVLKLGQFQGICKAIEWQQLDGVALCQGLKSLCLKNSGDLTDMGLIAIGRGCCTLSKFEVQGCHKITVSGIRTMTSLLKKTLVEVKISCCKNLDAVSSLQAMEPIRDRIQALHIDGVWDRAEDEDNTDHMVHSFDLNQVGLNDVEYSLFETEFENINKKRKRFKHNMDDGGECSSIDNNEKTHTNGFYCMRWDKLRYLSVWIGVGEILFPLPITGLDDCPNLEEIHIKVEGDCRGRYKPSERAFGLSCLARYPKLSKMKLDCGECIGYALTAPSGQMDLSLWERFFLYGIGELSLVELDYWPPQDRDVNQRSLSVQAAGLLAQCLTLRKLFIHGTAHEHSMMDLVRIPKLHLRDVQLREDYYPAPDNDMSTEMRVASCSRFEDALNRRQILD